MISAASLPPVLKKPGDGATCPEVRR